MKKHQQSQVTEYHSSNDDPCQGKLFCDAAAE
jgi:hypothetical protein